MSPTGWDTYIDEFHHDRPGITEAVLSRCTADGTTPYAWLTDGLTTPGAVVDLACGSGPTRDLLGPRWVGIDRNRTELTATNDQPVGHRVQADLGHLPIRTASADTIVCSMALMVLADPAAALAEVRRVAHEASDIRVLLPATRPLTIVDRTRYTYLAVALRHTRLWPPSPTWHHLPALLRATGLMTTNDTTRRFAYQINTAADAERFVASLYLPAANDDSRRRAIRRLSQRPGIELGVPLRRVTMRTSAR